MKRVGAEDARKLQEQGWTYVDVRSVGEFEAGHPAGAVNVPLNTPNFVDAMKARYAKDAKLIIACEVGGRSMRAVALLEQSGFSQLIDNGGGFAEWTALKLPSSKGNK